MSGIRKKQEEKNLKILRELLTFETNKYCFDCNQRGPTYVNITIGSFVCTNCGGALRKYSHRVKSISMSNFSQAEMDFIKKRGNNICKRIYYGLCENNVPPEMDIKNGMLDSHLRAKYELKKWYLEPASDLEEETLAQNQVIFDRVEKGVPKPVKSYTVNSSSNIIIEPPKQPINKPMMTSKTVAGSRTSIDLVETLSTSSSTKAPTNNSIDPSKLGGGSAVRLPMPNESKGSNWLSNTDIAPNQNIQSPFGDDFLFSTQKETSASFTSIPKSQTMNFNRQPLVPMQQSTAGHVPQAVPPASHQGEARGNMDRYAALAELDDLFSGAGRPQGGFCPQDQPQWPPQPVWPAAHPPNPFNPFATAAPPPTADWPGATPPANPFLVPGPASTNPFL